MSEQDIMSTVRVRINISKSFLKALIFFFHNGYRYYEVAICISFENIVKPDKLDLLQLVGFSSNLVVLVFCICVHLEKWFVTKYFVDNFSMTKCLQNSRMILRRMSSILLNIKRCTTFILSKIR